MIEAVATPSPHSSSAIVVQYETLRAAMLGEALPPDARSGLVVFLHHGMWEWARTVTPGTTRPEPLHATAFGLVEPDGARRTARRYSGARDYGNDDQ